MGVELGGIVWSGGGFEAGFMEVNDRLACVDISLWYSEGGLCCADVSLCYAEGGLCCADVSLESFILKK